MNLYLIERDNTPDWDEYRSAVVVAESEYEAKCIHPNGLGKYSYTDPSHNKRIDWNDDSIGGWVDSPEHVKVTLLGHVDSKYKIPENQVVMADYKAG